MQNYQRTRNHNQLLCPWHYACDTRFGWRWFYYGCWPSKLLPVCTGWHRRSTLL